jgi:hypothetical protein
MIGTVVTKVIYVKDATEGRWSSWWMIRMTIYILELPPLQINKETPNHHGASCSSRIV